MAYYSAACVANMRLKSFTVRKLRGFKDPRTKTAVYGQIYQFSNMALRQAK